MADTLSRRNHVIWMCRTNTDSGRCVVIITKRKSTIVLHDDNNISIHIDYAFFDAGPRRELVIVVVVVRRGRLGAHGWPATVSVTHVQANGRRSLPSARQPQQMHVDRVELAVADRLSARRRPRPISRPSGRFRSTGRCRRFENVIAIVRDFALQVLPRGLMSNRISPSWYYSCGSIPGRLVQHDIITVYSRFADKKKKPVLIILKKNPIPPTTEMRVLYHFVVCRSYAHIIPQLYR